MWIPLRTCLSLLARCLPYPFRFFFYCYGDHRDLHSFPTRRSSDLLVAFLQTFQYLYCTDGVTAEFDLRTNRLAPVRRQHKQDRKSTRLNSSHGYISYAVFCLKKKKLARIEAHITAQHSSVKGYGVW